jgi:hypothetical protein
MVPDEALLQGLLCHFNKHHTLRTSASINLQLIPFNSYNANITSYV